MNTLEIGVEKGRRMERNNMALEMLKNGESLEKIMMYTKLTEEEIKTLKEACKTS